MILPRPYIMCALALSAVSVHAEYTASFSSGKLPSRVIAENVNAVMPLMDFYSQGYTRYGWTVDRFGYEYVAMSPTHSGKDAASEGRLTFPVQDIEPGAVVRWTTRSAMADFPESYYVEAVVDGSEPVRLATVTDELGVWTTHVVSLEEFAGKQVTVRMVCNSTNRFMLLLRELYIGTPAEKRFDVTDRTSQYASGEGTDIVIEVTNSGVPVEDAVVECVNERESCGSQTVYGVWAPGETRTFVFSGPGYLGERMPYAVSLKAGEDEAVTLAEGSYYTSVFKRRLFVDKGTGMWCSNCPAGILSIEDLEQKYGDCLVAVDTHTNDVLANNAYFAALKFVAVPYFRLNRIKASEYSGLTNFGPYYDMPVQFGLEPGDVTGDLKSATVNVKVSFAGNIDNTSDRYRVGYVVTAGFYRPDDTRNYYQDSNVTSPSGRQYYLLPSKVPSELAVFHNVSVTSETAFTGIPASLPATIDAGGETTVSLTIDSPELLKDLSDARIAVFVLDTETGVIDNSLAVDIAGALSGMKDMTVENVPAPSHMGGGVIRFESHGDYTLEIFDAKGARILMSHGEADGITDVRTGLARGLYLIRLTTPEGVSGVKIIM